EPIDRIRPRLLPDLQHLVADFVDRLIPLDALPGAVLELHRIFQPPLAGDELAYRGALGAMRAAVDGRIPARLLADPYAVGDFRRHGAADRAVRADAFANGGTGGERAGGCGIRLAHACERQCADRGKAAGSETGATQEGAAIDAAPAVCSQSRERGTANLTFCFLDQHRCLPYFG